MKRMNRRLNEWGRLLKEIIEAEDKETIMQCFNDSAFKDCYHCLQSPDSKCPLRTEAFIKTKSMIVGAEVR